MRTFCSVFLIGLFAATVIGQLPYIPRPVRNNDSTYVDLLTIGVRIIISSDTATVISKNLTINDPQVEDVWQIGYRTNQGSIGFLMAPIHGYAKDVKLIPKPPIRSHYKKGNNSSGSVRETPHISH
jgi:hypothetical protein